MQSAANRYADIISHRSRKVNQKPDKYVNIIKPVVFAIKKARVNLAITINPKCGRFRGVAVGSAYVILPNLIKNHRKPLAFRAQSVFAVKMAR